MGASIALLAPESLAQRYPLGSLWSILPVVGARSEGKKCSRLFATNFKVNKDEFVSRRVA